MRVLLVTHYFPGHGGGVEIVAGELAVRLARRGFSITWAASSPAPTRPGDAVSYLPMNAWNGTERHFGFPYPLWGPAGLARLGSAVKECDLVHLHDCLYQGNAVALLRACMAGKPIVVTQHVGEVPYRQALLRGLLATANRTLGRMVLGGATQTVFISPKVLDYFRPIVRFRRTVVDTQWGRHGGLLSRRPCGAESAPMPIRRSGRAPNLSVRRPFCGEEGLVAPAASSATVPPDPVAPDRLGAGGSVAVEAPQRAMHRASRSCRSAALLPCRRPADSALGG